MPTIEDTIWFIKKAHKGQVDKAGLPYYLHPIRVMEKLPDGTPDNIKIAALLHDVLEDTPWTKGDLWELGFHRGVIDIVELLTNKKGQNYQDKIWSIIHSDNIGAVLVKYADILDNLDPKRLKLLPLDQQQRFLKKYDVPLGLLWNALVSMTPYPISTAYLDQLDEYRSKISVAQQDRA